MRIPVVLGLVAAMISGSAVTAQQSYNSGQPFRTKIGHGEMLNNDFLGDRRDRWQTASFVGSQVFGYGWDGSAPETIGELLEYRYQARIIAPGDVENPIPGDRLYSTSYSLGAHTHFDYIGNEITLGADLVVTGRQTGLPQFQTAVHNLLGRDVPSDSTLNDMVANGVHPGLVVELGRPLNLNGQTELRPFAELRTGDETLIRSGVDVYFGGLLEGDLLVRDQVTGQRYSAVRPGQNSGYGFVVGGDYTQMGQSIYFPDDRGPDMLDSRTRLRAGVVWQNAGNSVFYGMTWLSEEFDTQDEPQVVGSIRMNFEF